MEFQHSAYKFALIAKTREGGGVRRRQTQEKFSRMGKGAMKDGQGQGRRPRATDFAEVGAREGGLHADGRPKSATSQRLKQQSATIAELRGPDTTRLSQEPAAGSSTLPDAPASAPRPCRGCGRHPEARVSPRAGPTAVSGPARRGFPDGMLRCVPFAVNMEGTELAAA